MDNTSTYSTIKTWLYRLSPLSLLLLAAGLFFSLGLHQYLSFEQLQHHHQTLKRLTSSHYAAVTLLFMATYIVTVAISIPGALLLTLTGGLLFGTFLGSVYVAFSATAGAVLLYFAVRFAFMDLMNKKVGGKLALMRQGFQQNAFSYLLVLRIIPLFPFWLVNIVPALLNVPVKTYIAATFLGILPGTLIYASVGSSLNYLFTRNKAPDLTIIFHPHIFLPLLCLGLIILLPVFYKYWLNKSSSLKAANDDTFE